MEQAGDLSGKVLITCPLPLNAGNTELVIAHTSSGAETLAMKVPDARVVCAFNTVPSEVLFGVFEGRREAGRPSLVYCGDDSSSKRVAAELIQDAGFDSRGRRALVDRALFRALCAARGTARVRGKRGARN